MGRKKELEEQLVEEVEMELEDETSDEQEPTELNEAEEEEEEEEVVEDAPKKRAPRKRRAAKKAQPKEDEIVPVVAAAAAVVTPEVSAPVVETKHWEAAQKTSESIATHLEKVNAMLREIPDHYSGAIQKVLKNNTPKASPVARLAFGLSLVATVLSVLSLTFSQSARQAVLTQAVSTAPVPALQQPIHAPAETATAPKVKKSKVRVK